MNQKEKPVRGRERVSTLNAFNNVKTANRAKCFQGSTIDPPIRFPVCAAYESRTRKTGALQEDAGKLAEPEKPLKPLPHSSKGESEGVGSLRSYASLTDYTRNARFLQAFFRNFFFFVTSHKKRGASLVISHTFVPLSAYYAQNETIFANIHIARAAFSRGGAAQKAPYFAGICSSALDRPTDKLYNRSRQKRKRAFRNEEKERI